MYQTKKCFKSLAWSRPQRYGEFVAKYNAQRALRAQDQLNRWNESVSIFAEMQKELNALGKLPGYNHPVEVIHYAISIFDIASRCQDKLIEKELCCPESKKDAFEDFLDSLTFCGRHESGELRQDSEYGPIPYWNTTKVGEPITVDNIFFGQDHGYPSKPASYWIKLSKKKKMTLIEETTYKKIGGKLSKAVSVWQTEGLVKCGIYQFCTLAMQNFNDSLTILLEGAEL